MQPRSVRNLVEIRTVAEVGVTALIVCLIARYWLFGLERPLALDETGSIWAVQGGAAEILTRTSHLPQSIAYLYLLRGSEFLFGHKIWAWRLPSLIASLLTLAILIRLARRYLPYAGICLAVLLWIARDLNLGLAVGVRPYAWASLGVALVCLYADDCVKHASWRSFMKLGIACAIPGYFFPASMLLAAGVLGGVLVHYRRELRERFPLFLMSAAVMAAASAAEFRQLLGLHTTWSLHQLDAYGTWPSLARATLPIAVAAPVCLALAFRDGRTKAQMMLRKGSALKASGHFLRTLVPAIVFIAALFGLSNVLRMGLWSQRYWSVATLPTALGYALLLAALQQSSRLWLSLALAAVLLNVPTLAVQPITNVGTPDAFYPISDLAPVLVLESRSPATLFTGTPAYIEGRRWSFPPAEMDRQWLLSPLSVLLPDVVAAAIPRRTEQMSAAGLEELKRRIAIAPRVLHFGSGPPRWFDELLQPDFAVAEHHRSAYGFWQVVIYSRIAR